MFSVVDKTIMIVAAVILATLMTLLLTLNPSSKQEDTLCTEFCSLRDSEVRLHKDGVCVCQK